MLKFGRDEVFFDLLDGQAKVAKDAAEAFLAMIEDFSKHGEHAKRLMEIEEEGDELTRRLQTKIIGTFITPIDHEDLAELSRILDDVTDCAEAASARIEIYRLETVRPDVRPLATEFVKIVDLVVSAVRELRGNFARSDTLKATLDRMHEVESDSDVLFRAALGNLFHEEGIETLTIIKWKEVYDRIENAIDRCEDVAKMLDNMIVKYA